MEVEPHKHLYIHVWLGVNASSEYLEYLNSK